MSSYRLLSYAISPLMPLWLRYRASKGKEDKARLKERFGITAYPRPKGTLLWLHAASVGEATSVLLLVNKIRETVPGLHILLTTGTVTSARLMQQRLPPGAIHQYVPIDTPKATERFISHWHPDLAFWVESEFWPNLIAKADEYECFMGIINARMSERSFEGWKKRPALINNLLKRFNLIFAQSESDGKRLEALGASDVMCLGNLKYDAPLLPCDEGELLRLQKLIAGRPVWLAASTHAGEDEMIATAHQLLSATRPNLLTVIVPRHADRGAAIATSLGKQWKVSQRSQNKSPTPDVQIYIADTMGELGLFYRLCEIVFMGGSLVPHGGQNPLEPARLACAIASGPHTHNFADMYHDMEAAKLVLRATSPHNLAATIDQLLNNASMRNLMQSEAKKWVEAKSGTAERLMVYLEPLLQPRKGKA